MRKAEGGGNASNGKRWTFSHLLLAMLLAAVFLPNQKKVASAAALLAAVAIIEMIYIVSALKRKYPSKAGTDIVCIVWVFLLLWELSTSVLNWMHPVLVPAPEDVFNVFAVQWRLLLKGVFSSLQLLAVGMLLGICAGVGFGLCAGWLPRLRGIFWPVAQVLAPIPPVVYAPYLIAVMPNFRSASALVIFLGIFWPTFLSMIVQVRWIDPGIIDTARTLGVSNRGMIPYILLPSVFPGVVGGLKVTLSTSIMLLCFAEMMGATSGMGYYIINYIHYANYTNVVAGIILVGVVVTLLNKVVDFIQGRAIPWK